MSIVLIELSGLLAQTQEATLRLRMNRANRAFWRNMAHVSLADWPARRDAEISATFDHIAGWLDIWSMPDGDHVIRKGIGSTIAHKTGDIITFTHRSGSGQTYSLEEVWTRGEACPIALTRIDIAAAWDERVQWARLLVIQQEHVPPDCVRTWPPEEQAAVDAVYSLCAAGKWHDALDTLRASVGRRISYYLVDYLERLTSGAST